MSLRDEAIEVVARSMFESSSRELRELEADLPGDRYEIHAHSLRQYAAFTVDALLEFLDAHTEEWADAAQPDNDRVHYEGVAAELIRGLR